MSKPVAKKMIHTTGSRKRAKARATLYPGKGIIRINKKILKTLNPLMARQKIMEPLLLSEGVADQVNINVKVIGGGWQGQTEAVRTAIARALVAFDKKLKKPFLDYDRHLLIQDVRFKETRKPNDSKARSSRQKSYR